MDDLKMVEKSNRVNPSKKKKKTKIIFFKKRQNRKQDR